MVYAFPSTLTKVGFASKRKIGWMNTLKIKISFLTTWHKSLIFFFFKQEK